MNGGSTNDLTNVPVDKYLPNVIHMFIYTHKVNQDIIKVDYHAPYNETSQNTIYGAIDPQMKHSWWLWKAKTKIYKLSLLSVTQFDDRTFHKLIRSPRSSEVANNSHNGSAFAFDSAIFGVDTFKFSLDNMADNNRTLKELATSDIMCQPWCIRYPKLEQAQSYELKSRLIHLVPKFHGLTSNTQQFDVREFAASRVVNEHHISPLVRVCDICASIEHPVDVCPTLQETELNNAEVDAMISDQ
ncbi:hypothetical protein CR513_36996, partial [Mucuna pruriens]